MLMDYAAKIRALSLTEDETIEAGDLGVTYSELHDWVVDRRRDYAEYMGIPAAVIPPKPDFDATPVELFDWTMLPERQWLYGVHLIRKYTSATVAAPGTGKSTLAMIDAVSIASGKVLSREYVHERANVWLYNLEDPRDELQKRLAAVCIKNDISLTELAGRLFIDSGRDQELCIVKRVGGLEYIFPDKDKMIEAITRHKIGAVIIDPFISSYDGDENNNKDVDRAVKTFNAIADATGCAIELIHHTGKSGNEAGSQNAGRGGSALVGAIRSLRTLMTMTEDEANESGVLPTERFSYVRIDGAKSNMSRRDGKPHWMKLDGVKLGNGPDGGDEVAIMSPWEAPGLFDGVGMAKTIRCLETLGKGRGPGLLWNLKSGPRGVQNWAGTLIAEQLAIPSNQAGRMLATWINTGVITGEDYQNEHRTTVVGAVVNGKKLDEMKSS